MSMSLRKRVGLAFAGVVIAAPFVAASVANGATTTITFSGSPLLGISTLACPSTPSQTKLTVSPGTVVDFINRTGRTATLWAGNSQKSLPDKSLVPVTFAQGPTSVLIQMVPDCSLDLGSHAQMTVEVNAPGQPRDQSPPATPTATASNTQAPGATGTSSATPRDGSTPKTPDPAHSTAALAPAQSPATGESDGTSMPGAGSDNTSTGNNDPFAAAPPLSSPILGDVQGPAVPRSASGLLTLIATVGVVGVSAAVIRAIISQRAIRALSVQMS